MSTSTAALQAAGSRLKKVGAPFVKGPHVDEKGMNCMEDMYNACHGDLQKLADRGAFSLFLLEKSPPEDSTDFAHKALAGVYSADDGH